MQRRIIVVLVCLFTGLNVWAGDEYPAKPGERIAANELIVRLKQGAVAATLINGYVPGAQVQSLGRERLFRVSAAAIPPALSTQIASNPLVEWVEPNRIRYAVASAPNDPIYGSSWWFPAVQALQAWSILPGQYLTAATAGTGRIKVAVLDTGADCTHPDFINTGGNSTNSALGGQLMFSASQALVPTTISSPACAWQDDHGHGTHVTGILAAATSNGVGVSGLGYPVQVIEFKVLDSQGSGFDTTIASAIMAAADAGARIVSLSLGGDGYSQTLQTAVNYAWQRNTLVVAAAGNSATNTLFFPAGANHAVGVSATDSNNNLANFSNFGNSVHLAAPGVGIMSTAPTYTVSTGWNNYISLSGTSMATPFVSALAGLVAMTTPSATVQAILQRMEQSANSNTVGGGWNQSFGYGLISASNAVGGVLRTAANGGISGQVVNSTGNPITSAQVTINGQTLTTDSSGLYRFATIPAGTYSVSVTAPTFAAQSLSLTVAPGADTNFTVTMGVVYGRFTGSVTDQGVGAAGAIVQAVSAGLIAAAAVADPSGNYTLWVPGGTYDLQASAIGSNTATVSSLSVSAGGTTSANITLPRMGTILGTVRDENLNPVANAQLLLTGGSFSAGATSNGSGNYSMIGVPNGTQYSVTATAAGFLPATQNGIAVNPDVTTNVSLTMPSVFVATPSFAPPGGSYTSAQSVTISTTTAGASIRYTTDGSTPSSTVGTVYSGPVSVSSSLTLKAIAYKAGLTDSGVASSVYTITSGGGGWSNGYSYRRAITIDHTKVANSDQTNFPVLVTGTYPYLANTGNGGSVINPNGYDVIFTSDQAGSNILPFERESYSSTSGKASYWIKLASVSHTTDTVIYMFYGNPSVASDPSNKTAVWDSNYKLVYHMADNAANTTVADSSANANNVINSANTSGKSTTAQISAGLTYSAAGDDGASSNSVTLGGAATFSTWFKAGSFAGYARLMETNYANSYYLGMNGAANKFYWIVNGGSGGGCGDGYGSACTSTALTPGTWYYLTGTFDGTTARMYLNGAQEGADTPTAPGTQSMPLYLNRYLGGGYREDGVYDEVRVSSVARSSDWIATEYSNQNAPGAFYSIGSPQSGGSGTVAITVTSSPAGLALSVDGSTCTAPCNQQWVPGSNHVIAVTSTPQAGSTGTQYSYTSWSDAGSQSHSITVPASPTAYTANFATQYFLTTSAGSGGTISPASAWFTSGAVASVSATANTGFTFSNFSGDLTGTATPQNLAMNAPKSVTANFTSGGGGWSNGYSYRRAITIDHTKVANSDQTNFPVLVTGTYPYLANTGNGGSVINPNGYDVIFTSDQAGSNILPFERESYSSTSGKASYWIKLASVSHTTDTVIYMFYGNPSVASDPSNKTAVWDSNYKLVYHMADNAANTTVADSSANANNVINSANTSGKSTTAQISAGLTYSAAGDDGASSNSVTLGGAATFSTWFKAGSFAGYARLMETNYANSYYLGMNGAANKFYWIVNGGSGGGCGDGYGSACTSTALTPGTWYYLTGTFDGTTARMYLNGAQEGADTPTAPGTQSMPLYLNRYLGGGYREDGVYDEVRVSSVARSSDWIATEYSNQNSPGTFLSVGAQDTGSSTQQVATAAFTPAGGSYSSAQSVTIGTTTAGASIRYTTDGSVPTSSTGTLYSGPVLVSSSLTLKAIAYKAGMTDSGVASSVYTITSGGGGPSWYNASWTNRKAITVDHTKVSGGGSLTNFPLLFSAIDANLKSVANGGRVGKADGTDLVFTASDGTTKLDHELESYNPSTGQVIAWVRLPSLSASADTVVYAYYGNPAAADQQNKTGVWDSNYKLVWHLANGTTLSGTDSTTNGNGGIVYGPAGPGEIGGGAAGTVEGQTIAVPGGDQTRTLECWFKITGNAGADQVLCGMGYDTGVGSIFSLVYRAAGSTLSLDAKGIARSFPWTYNSNWHHLAATYSSGAGLQNAVLYLDGVQQTTTGGTGTLTTQAATYIDVQHSPAYPFNDMTGIVDEFRISSVARPAAWMLTEYNNQSLPGAFFSLGAQE